MSKLIDTLKMINTYLQNNTTISLSDVLSAYGDKKDQFKNDFYEKTINDMSTLDRVTDSDESIIEEILNALNIPKKKRGRFINAPLTMYQLLKELDGLFLHSNKKLADLIETIDKKRKGSWRNIIIASGLGLVGIEIAGPLFRGVLIAINHLISAVLFIPIVSAIVAMAIFLHSVIDRMVNKKKISFWEAAEHNFFDFATVALKMTAFSLVIVAAAVMTSPLVSSLVVLGTAISIVKELFGFIHLRRHIKNEHKVDGEKNEELMLEAQQLQCRHDCDYLKRRNSLLINVAGAILFTGIIAAWSFIPGGLFVMVGALVAMVLLAVVKRLVHSYNESSNKKLLVEKLERLEKNADLPRQENTQTAEVSTMIAISAKMRGLMPARSEIKAKDASTLRSTREIAQKMPISGLLSSYRGTLFQTQTSPPSPFAELHPCSRRDGA